MAAKKDLPENKEAEKTDAAKKEAIPEGVVVKKIKPYPFEALVLVKDGAPPVKVAVLKITDVGFLMRVEQGAHHFLVGDDHRATFRLPGTPYAFNELMKVIKTYDSMDFERAKSFVKHYTVEMHFRSLSREQEGRLMQFLKAIHQK